MTESIEETAIRIKAKYTLPGAIILCRNCIEINEWYKREFPFLAKNCDERIALWKSVLKAIDSRIEVEVCDATTDEQKTKS